MSVPKRGRYPWGQIVHQMKYRLSDSNTNLDIKCSALA
jgi:hypothetical protein